MSTAWAKLPSQKWFCLHQSHPTHRSKLLDCLGLIKNGQFWWLIEHQHSGWQHPAWNSVISYVCTIFWTELFSVVVIWQLIFVMSLSGCAMDWYSMFLSHPFHFSEASNLNALLIKYPKAVKFLKSVWKNREKVCATFTAKHFTAGQRDPFKNDFFKDQTLDKDDIYHDIGGPTPLPLDRSSTPIGRFTVNDAVARWLFVLR